MVYDEALVKRRKVLKSLRYGGPKFDLERLPYLRIVGRTRQLLAANFTPTDCKFNLVQDSRFKIQNIFYFVKPSTH
jgi:hypothetical protein